MTQEAPWPGFAVQRRSTRRWLVRAVAGLTVVLAVGYASIPLWFPTDWLARRVVNQLSADLNRPVHIGGVSVGWIKGVVFEELTIGDAADGSPDLLARIGRLQCAFQPIRTLLTDRVDHVAIDGVELFLAMDENGQFNIADLGQKEWRPRLPSQHYFIRSLACHVRTPRATETLSMDRLECHLEQDTGLLRMLGEVRARQESLVWGTSRLRRLNIHAHVQVPRLKRDVNLRGEVRIEWSGLALTDLPIALIAQVPIEQVDGTTTGGVTLKAQPDLGLDFDLDIALKGVRIRRATWDRSAQVPDAEIRAKGHWDPNTDLLIARELAYQTPGIRFSGVGDSGRPALRVDLDGGTPLELRVEGVVKDWLRLAGEWPLLDGYARRAGVSLAGGADFSLDVSRQRQEDHGLVSLDARRSACTVVGEGGTYLAAGMGTPKKLKVDLVVGHRDGSQWESRANMTLGTLSLSAQGGVSWPARDPDAAPWVPEAWIEKVLPTVRAQVALQCERMEDLPALLPRLTQSGVLRDGRGPFNLAFACTPAQGTSRIDLSATMGTDAQGGLGDLLVKRPGKPLSVTLGLGLPCSATGHVNPIHCQVDYGRGKLVLSDKSSQLAYHIELSEAPGDEAHGDVRLPARADASWVIPLRIEDIDTLCSLWPAWETWRQPRKGLELRGSTDLVLQGNVSHCPEDFLLRWEADVVGDDLTIRYDEAVDKPAGVPLKLNLAHRFETLGPDRDQSLRVTLQQPAGTVTGAIRFGSADSPGPQRDFEYASFRADVRDAAGWLSIVPGLVRRIRAHELNGPLSLAFESLTVAGRQAISLAADATGAGFEIPGAMPFTKSPGIPVQAGFKCEWSPLDARSGSGSWELKEGHVQLGPVQLGEFSGRVLGTPPARGAPSTLPIRAILRGAPLPVVEAVDLSAALTVDFQEPWDRLHPLWREWGDRLGLGGTLDGRIAICADGDETRLTGVLDAMPLSLTMSTDHHLAPMLHKHPGTPAALTFDVVVQGGWGLEPRCLSVREADLEWDGNTASATGELTFAKQLDATSLWDHIDLAADVRLDHPNRLMDSILGSPIELIAGRGELGLALTFSDGQWTAGSGCAEFDGFTVAAGSEPIELNGTAAFDDTTIDLDPLQGRWGRSMVAVSGGLRGEGASRVGRVGVVFDELDARDLGWQWRLSAARLGSHGAAMPETDQPAARTLIDQLRQLKATLDVRANVLKATLPPRQHLVADAASAVVQVDKGTITTTFRGLVDGGLVTGQFESQIDAADPTFHLTYAANDIQPGPLVSGYLKRMFPGMTATGPLTLIDETYQKMLPSEEDPNYEVGNGQLLIQGGSIEGRAVPLWLTRIFPGLNLARFDFSYLHSWFNKLPDGRIRHQMIYQGRYYNIYMIGHSYPDRRFEYEVGIDFLADFDSKYWAESGQGRIPLFVKTGRMDEAGNLSDERVTYVPPQRVLDTLFIRNNPVVTVYFAVRKRVLGQP